MSHAGQTRRILSSFQERRFARAFDATLLVWAELDDLAERHHLPRTEIPNLGLSPAIFQWAKGGDLNTVLRETGGSAGEFVRWVRQTIDMLDQIFRLVPTSRP